MDLMSVGTKVTFLWRLVNATSNGSLSWEPYEDPTSEGGDIYEFMADIGRFRYFIRSRDSDDYAPFNFEIWALAADAGGKNRQVDTWYSDDTLSPGLVDPLRVLYQEAKKRALGLNTIVTDMFEDLAAIDGLPSDPEVERRDLPSDEAGSP